MNRGINRPHISAFNHSAYDLFRVSYFLKFVFTFINTSTKAIRIMDVHLSHYNHVNYFKFKTCNDKALHYDNESVPSETWWIILYLYSLLENVKLTDELLVNIFKY